MGDGGCSTPPPPTTLALPCRARICELFNEVIYQAVRGAGAECAVDGDDLVLREVGLQGLVQDSPHTGLRHQACTNPACIRPP